MGGQWCFWPWALCAVLMLAGLGAVGAESSSAPGRQAYATLLYGDEFLLGVRVLGQSLRESGTMRDMVVIVSAGVTKEAAQQLQNDGWIVKRVDLVSNPSKKFPTRFWGVYTKLSIFNLTDYSRVVYLDADSIVVRSVDDAFSCAGFCAVLRHSERLNSGFLVVEPSSALYADMMAKIEALPSYTGGDQGFLNAYYEGFVNAPLYDPDQGEGTDGQRMHRLPTAFNGDIGLYVLNSNKWMVPEPSLRMIHYTLGPLKPWDWWTGFLLPPVAHWHAMRRRLSPSQAGEDGGLSPERSAYLRLLAAVPLLLAAFLVRKHLLTLYQALRKGHPLRRATAGLPLYSTTAAMQQGHSPNQQFGSAGCIRTPPLLEALSVGACFASALLALGLAAWLVPRQVPPWTGLLLLFEWTAFGFGVAFCKYLELLQFWGRKSTAPPPPEAARYVGSPKGRGKPGTPADWEPAAYFAAMAALAALTPCLPYLAGITSVFGRLGAVLVGAFFLIVFMTYSSQRLAVRAFCLGRDPLNRPTADMWDL